MVGPILLSPVNIQSVVTYSPCLEQQTNYSLTGIVRIEVIDCRLENQFRIFAGDGKMFCCKTLPKSTALLMRSEYYMLENEVAVYQRLRAASILAAELVPWQDSQLSNGELLFTQDSSSGRPLSECDYVDEEERSIISQVERIRQDISSLESSQFGSAYRVAKGEGHKYWHEAFRDMVEQLLEDGEDVLLNLPYIKVREVLDSCSSILANSDRCSLFIRGLDEPSNILVREIAGMLKVVGFDDLSHAIWADPDFEISSPCLSEQSTKQTLYGMYFAIRDIVEGFYHKRSHTYDSKPRQNLAMCLEQLSIYILDLT